MGNQNTICLVLKRVFYELISYYKRFYLPFKGKIEFDVRRFTMEVYVITCQAKWYPG